LHFLLVWLILNLLNMCWTLNHQNIIEMSQKAHFPFIYVASNCPIFSFVTCKSLSRPYVCIFISLKKCCMIPLVQGECGILREASSSSNHAMVRRTEATRKTSEGIKTLQLLACRYYKALTLNLPHNLLPVLTLLIRRGRQRTSL
jgi:hypothetical protein